MLLQSIYAKVLRERAVGLLIAVGSLFLVSWMGVAVYASIGDTATKFIESMPKEFLAITGISVELGGSGLILSEMANLLAPVVLVGIIITVGADAVAGEERWGTIGVLLANPRSRLRLVVEKSLALVTIAVVGVVGTWAGFRAAAAIQGASLDGIDLVAALTHLLALVLFFGALTLCVGAWTGDTLRANLTGAGVLLITMFSAPVLADTAHFGWVARLMPWYYLNAADPIKNGASWGHVALLAGAAAVLFVAAAFGVKSRDLKVGEARVTLVDRLKRNERFGAMAQRIAGRSQVSSITAKAVSDGQGTLTVVGGIMIYMAALLGPIFKPTQSQITQFVADFPDWILAMVGNVTYSTPAEWYHGEIFSLMAPAAAVVVGVGAASRALAGEERARTMGVLLANPVTRGKVVVDKAVAMAALVAGVSAATFVGVAAGNLIGRLKMSYVDMAAASLHMFALGIAMGAVALFAGCGERTAREWR